MKKIINHRKRLLGIAGFLIAAVAYIGSCQQHLILCHTAQVLMTTLFCIGLVLVFISTMPIKILDHYQTVWILTICSIEYPKCKVIAVFNHHPKGDEILNLRKTGDQSLLPESLKDCDYLSRDNKLQGFHDERWTLVKVTTSTFLPSI